MEQALVERADLTFEAISAIGLRGKHPLAMAGGLWTLGQGYRQSRQIIHRFRPDVLFVTGGYVCVPVTLAAWRAGVPIVIYLPDIEPGLAIKFLARFADRVAVTAAETQPFFAPDLTTVTGYPVRPDLFAVVEAGKAAARQRLGLADDLPVLLVFGGSQGARSINQAVTEAADAYLKVCQIIHVTGRLDEAWVQEKRSVLPAALQERYHVSAYLHEEMIWALAAADLVISRAGASTLGEFPAAGLPAILVPYPYAGAHQRLNAGYLVRHRAALMMDNVDLSEKLKETVLDLLTDTGRLEAMSQASRTLARPDAARRLAHAILELSHVRN